MRTIAVILARAGSKGLRDKCVLPLCGRPLLAYTIGHAQQSHHVEQIVLSTDSPRAADIGQQAGIDVISRPAELADDTARVDEAARHAVRAGEDRARMAADAVVILYGNVPVRQDGIIDRCVEHLFSAGCDSVRTVAPAGKYHPDWMHQMDGDRLVQYRPNSIHRRQDLTPAYYHDSAVIAVTRTSLFAAEGSPDPHAFFGVDRRAVVQKEEDTVDVDGIADLYRAEALIRMQNEAWFLDRPPAPTGASRRPVITAAVAIGGAHERW